MDSEHENLTKALNALQHQKYHLSRSLQKVKKSQSLRALRAWHIASVAFCHHPEHGENIATQILRRYSDCFNIQTKDFVTQLQKRFLDTTVDQLVNWLEWKTGLTRREEEQARQLVHELNLISWIDAQNQHQGVSPTPALVWEKRCELTVSQTPPRLAWEPHCTQRTFASVKWMQRFKRRWRLVSGKLPIGDIVPLPDMRTKAMFGIIFLCFIVKRST